MCWRGPRRYSSITFAPSIVVLDIARGVGGIGASAAITSGSTLIAARFHGPARVRAFGLFGTALGAGLAFGPLISGVMVTVFDWRGVFAVPAAVGLLVAALSPLLGESRNSAAQRLDWPGTFTFTAGLFLFIFALVEGPAFGWASPLFVGSLAGFVVLMALFYMVEKRRHAPMLDLSLLRHARFMGISAAAMALAFSLLPLLVLLPTYFSAVEGYSALHSGGILVLFTAPMLVMPLFATRMSRLLSLRAQLAGAMVLVAGGMAWLTVVGPGVGVGVLAGPLLLAGFGYGITLAVLDGAAVSSVKLEQAGMAAGMFNALRLTGDTAASAIGGTLLISVTAARLAGKVANPHGVTESLNSGTHTTLPAAAAAFTSALHVVIWIGAALAAITVPILLRTLRTQPQTTRLLASSDTEFDAAPDNESDQSQTLSPSK
jgi:predicted MFS family arabinose efflux permease